MTRCLLAFELRGRLRKKSLVPETTLANTSDNDVIESYTRCAKCQKVWVKKAALNMMIREAMNTEEFIMMASPEGCC